MLGAGFCNYVPGANGLVAVPKSMAFDEMDEAEFAELDRKTDEFLYTDHAQAILWPQLQPQQRWNCLTSFLEDLRR